MPGGLPRAERTHGPPTLRCARAGLERELRNNEQRSFPPKATRLNWRVGAVRIRGRSSFDSSAPRAHLIQVHAGGRRSFSSSQQSRLPADGAPPAVSLQTADNRLSS
jgi:hypothetical protein